MQGVRSCEKKKLKSRCTPAEGQSYFYDQPREAIIISVHQVSYFKQGVFVPGSTSAQGSKFKHKLTSLNFQIKVSDYSGSLSC